MSPSAALLTLLVASAALPAVAQLGPTPTRAERAFHESLIVLDTHFDTPANQALADKP